MGQDDEASIGLLAFNEAIDKYSEDKGAKFLTFAEIVIKRRLTDYYRKESRFTNNVLHLSDFNSDENQEQEMLLEVQEANKAYQIEEEAFNTKQEIIQYTKNLAEFGGNTYEGVLLYPGAFAGMTTLAAREPNLTSQAWHDSLYIAGNMATQYNPIGACLWFVTNSYYEDNSRTYNGQEQYTFNGGSTWKNIVEKYVIGSHTFFRVTGY